VGLANATIPLSLSGVGLDVAASYRCRVSLALGGEPDPSSGPACSAPADCVPPALPYGDAGCLGEWERLNSACLRFQQLLLCTRVLESPSPPN
jgi:hypothetical protein